MRENSTATLLNVYSIVCVCVLLRVEPSQPDQQFLWPTLITHNVLLCQVTVCWRVCAHSVSETVSVYVHVCVFFSTYI